MAIKISWRSEINVCVWACEKGYEHNKSGLRVGDCKRQNEELQS